MAHKLGYCLPAGLATLGVSKGKEKERKEKKDGMRSASLENKEPDKNVISYCEHTTQETKIYLLNPLTSIHIHNVDYGKQGLNLQISMQI